MSTEIMARATLAAAIADALNEYAVELTQINTGTKHKEVVVEATSGVHTEVTAAATGPVGNAQETATPVADAVPDVSAELDVNGVPWDERIHSGSKNKTVKGVWSRRRNLTDAFFNQVLAELQGPVADGSSAPSTHAPVAEAPAAAPIAPAPATAPATAPVAPVPPKPAVFPEPANMAGVTHAECEDIMAFYATKHGADAAADIMAAWQMQTLEQLTEDLRPQFVDYMRIQDQA